MRILLRERDRQNRRFTMLLDERPRLAAADHPHAAAPLTLTESSELVLRLYPDELATFQARVYVGNVLMASTLESDRPDYLLEVVEADPGKEHFACSGRLFKDWVGQTELAVDVWSAECWQRVLVAGLSVTAGKMEQEAFRLLCTAIADHSAAVLLDVYGKTFLGLEPERRLGESVPVATLQRVRQAIDQIDASLRAIARRPAYRLKTRRVREPALAEQSVSDLTVEETCVDPTLAVATGTAIRFREHVREVASPSFDLAENRLISGFLHFLALQIGDLKTRMRHEVQLREERHSYRHRRGGEGGKTWWESEDLPRIEELQKLLTSVTAMERDLARLRTHAFLPGGAQLREVPQATPLIRSHKAYASAFKVIVMHFMAYRVHLDDQHLLMRAKSLPVLYEWWCMLEVLHLLQSCLSLSKSTAGEVGSPFRRRAEERERFVIEFDEDQAVDFRDEQGWLIRLRYVPHYQSGRDSRGRTYGQLGQEGERTPDIALEIFPPAPQQLNTPELIIVLDAKYSSVSHQQKLEEVKRKYAKLGVFKSGRVLSRQVWALTPAPPQTVETSNPEWASFCTVDNQGFWSEEFEMASSVAGVVQAKPQMPAGRSPLECLLRLLLKRAGVVLQGERSR
jgi:hypothetical protein